MSKSKWERNDLDSLLPHIVARFNGEVVDVYRIARIIEDEYPDVYRDLGFAIGGERSGVVYSLPTYIARFGSERANKRMIYGIEFVPLADIQEGMEVAKNKDGTPLRSSVDHPAGFRTTT